MIKRMHKEIGWGHGILVGLAFLVLAIAGQSASAALLSDNFNSYTDGQSFNSGYGDWTLPGNAFQSATATTSAESPFTSAVDGKGLRTECTGLSSNRFLQNSFTESASSISLQFDAQARAFSDDNLSYMVNIVGTSGSTVAIWLNNASWSNNFRIDISGTMLYGSWGVGLTRDAWYHFDVDLAIVDGDVTVVGSATKYGEATPEFTWDISKADWDGGDEFSAIQIGYNQGGTPSGAYDVDNISVVPEPATLSLIGFGVACSHLRRKRRMN